VNLKVGQYYRVTSAVAEGYQEIHGPFSFVVRVYELSRSRGTPLTPISGDLTLRLVDWEPMNGFRDDPWFAAYSMAIGNTKYGEMCMKVPPEKVQEINWSPDVINGSGRWYVPDLFRWQHLFLYLVRHDAVECVEFYHPH
jgi:hypothetical protein